MIDREKIIENMNIAKAVLCNQNIITPEMCIKIGQTISDVLSLLKEQEPQQVVITTNSYGTKFYHCPKCNHDLYAYPRQNYCSNCGQAVKY